jgi:hypothetical protein
MAQNEGKVLETACRFVADYTGTCPLDQFDFVTDQCTPDDCPNPAANEMWVCWKKYFEARSS